MPKTSQSKLDYIKRWKQAKREEAKQNGAQKPIGRPKRTTPLSAEEVERRQVLHRSLIAKNNAKLKQERAVAREERNRQKAEINELLNWIKSAQPEQLAKVRELICPAEQ